MTYVSEARDVHWELIATARFEIVNDDGRWELLLPFPCGERPSALFAHGGIRYGSPAQ